MPTEDGIMVFLSSVMSQELQGDRDAVERATRCLGYARLWRFEYSPASTASASTEYLSKVHDCNVFIALLAETSRNL
jgi:hypothetical protein